MRLRTPIPFSPLLLWLMVSFLSIPVIAQPPGDFRKNGTNAIPFNYQAPDLNNVLFEEDLKDTSKASETYFNLGNSDYEIDTNFLKIEEEDFQYVQTDEQINASTNPDNDTNWVTIAKYFEIWDSRTINPYKINGADFKDSVQLTLFDSLTSHYYAMPLNEVYVTSKFGWRRYRWHYGTDLNLRIGDPVMSTFDGIVRIVQYQAGGYGNFIVVRHYNGLETLYGHLTRTAAKVGQKVKAGDIIGYGGSTGRSTGPHLHFEVRYEGNAIDPETIFDFANKKMKMQKFLLTPEHFRYLSNSGRKISYHRVRSGESLGSISQRYRISVAQLCRLNGITTRTVIQPGRLLRIW